MKVWSAVYMYNGLISDMSVFSTKEAARKYFFDIVDNEGGIEACDPEYYQDGSDETGAFYWWDGIDDEITIMCVEVRD